LHGRGNTGLGYGKSSLGGPWRASNIGLIAAVARRDHRQDAQAGGVVRRRQIIIEGLAID
jgi:hypothetical protein